MYTNMNMKTCVADNGTGFKGAALIWTPLGQQCPNLVRCPD